MNERLFDNNYRREFIKNADFKILNEYLKGMEKLSKKGGKYLEIYNADIEYLLDDNIFPPDTMSLDLFFGNNSNNVFNHTEISMCDTETNINHINKIIDIRQKNYFDELNKIHDDLRNDTNIKHTIKNFIDIVVLCSLINSLDESQIYEYFKNITSLIKDNKTAIYEGYKYFDIVLKRHRKKIILDFIKKISTLKNNKNNNINYKLEKDILIQNSSDIYGFESIMTTILFNKIYNSYKKMQQ
jgi:hypothetical protein